MTRFIYVVFIGLYFFSTNLLAMESKVLESVTLSFSDNRQSVTNFSAINDTLKTVGVHLSRVALPLEALPILKLSTTTKLNEEQISSLLKIFSLTRKDLLYQISIAGRKPVIPNGGSLSTGEVGVAPYPKVYDMKAMSPQDHIYVQNKFGKLHVNSTDSGEGVDEVMTLVSGGPWTWYFLLKDNVVAKLSLSRIQSNGQGWRLSYPGLTPHGAYMNAEDGVVIAYITGPKTWVMKYDAPKIEGAKMLGKNPWVDFSNNRAK
ncbi:MAG: hypothetical protein JKY42_00310 [Flavobacteriales bacterium]|nr:hypothetical protein [Flavobacteriales bacterium]